MAAAAGNNMPTAFEREQIIGMMEKEMEYRVDMFNKLTHTRFNKCIEHNNVKYGNEGDAEAMQVNLDIIPFHPDVAQPPPLAIPLPLPNGDEQGYERSEDSTVESN